MSIADYLRILRNHWLVIAAIAAACALSGGVYSWIQAPIYQAEAQVFVSTDTGGDIGQMTQSGTFTQQRVKSYADIVASPPVLQPVIDKLGLPYDAQALAKAVTATSPLDTVLLNIQVTDTSADRARDIANAIATRFPEVVNALETPAGEATSRIKVSVTKAAVTPEAPIKPRKTLNILLGLLIGLGLGVGLAVLRDSLDKSVSSKEEAQELAGAPVLTVVGEDPDADTNRLITHDAFSPRAEAFRQLRTNIRFLSVDHQVRSLVVTSSVPGEGKSTTSSNLAIALAQSGETVVLIDADLRRPTVADVFALSSGVGLTSVLLGDLPIDDALQTWREDLPLRILTAGPLPPNPSELIGSTRMAALISSLTEAGVTVVLDSPPLLPVTDAALLARASDGALVVARAASTHGEQLASACESLRIAGATVLGVVLNRVPRRRSASYYGGYDSYRSYRSKAAPEQGASNALADVPALPEPVSATAYGRDWAMPPVEATAQIDSPSPLSASVRQAIAMNPLPPAPPAVAPAPQVIDLESGTAARARLSPREETPRPTSPGPTANGSWSAIPPSTRRQARRPEVDWSAQPAQADSLTDATIPPDVDFEPGITDLTTTWHVEWGELPALINAPRTDGQMNGQLPGSSARHRN